MPKLWKKKHDVEKILGSILKKEKLKYKISTKFTIDKYLLKDKKITKKFKKSTRIVLKKSEKDTIDNYFFHSGTDEEFLMMMFGNF